MYVEKMQLYCIFYNIFYAYESVIFKMKKYV